MDLNTSNEWLSAFISITEEFEGTERFLLSSKEKIMDDDRYLKMLPLCHRYPRLKNILEDELNEFVDSTFTMYFYRRSSYYPDDREEKLDNLHFTIDICGIGIKTLNIEGNGSSNILPSIKLKCPNLKVLKLRLQDIEEHHFIDFFINMHSFKKLIIYWENQVVSLPIQFVNSMQRIVQTLKTFCLIYDKNKSLLFLRSSIACVFSRCILITKLHLHFLGLKQEIIESISHMKNLEDLKLLFPPVKNDLFGEINFASIGKLTNLKLIEIDIDCGMTDEFLINLADNSKEMEKLYIVGTYLTDLGVSALARMKSITSIELGLDKNEKTNILITDDSVVKLTNPILESLYIDNCKNITNKGVIELLLNLPSLRFLSIKRTNANYQLTNKIYKVFQIVSLNYVKVDITFNVEDNVFEDISKKCGIHLVVEDNGIADYAEYRRLNLEAHED